MKKTALLCGVVVAAATAALIIALRSAGKADAPTQRMHLRGWKTMMRWTLVGYWAVALLGIATYRVWYA